MPSWWDYERALFRGACTRAAQHLRVEVAIVIGAVVTSWLFSQSLLVAVISGVASFAAIFFYFWIGEPYLAHKEMQEKLDAYRRNNPDRHPTVLAVQRFLRNYASRLSAAPETPPATPKEASEHLRNAVKELSCMISASKMKEIRGELHDELGLSFTKGYDVVTSDNRKNWLESVHYLAGVADRLAFRLAEDDVSPIMYGFMPLTPNTPDSPT